MNVWGKNFDKVFMYGIVFNYNFREKFDNKFYSKIKFLM